LKKQQRATSGFLRYPFTRRGKDTSKKSVRRKRKKEEGEGRKNVFYRRCPEVLGKRWSIREKEGFKEEK